MTAQNGMNDNWHPWEFKIQRPDKVPGCQDTSWLPTLDEGQSTCGEGQQCYYFSCGKCSSSLALDIMNSEYKTDLEYLPRIANIESPDLFKKDNKFYHYHGEIFELYFKFFAQIKELTGIAINSWKNSHAEMIFNGVAETFRGTKFPKTKDFEIDWILFNGSTITVIEVKANTEESKSSRNFWRKVEQIKKDQIVMQHLLKVTGCEDIKVNYVIACPNVSIKEITEGRLLKDHRNFFQTLTSCGCGLGFISEESIRHSSLYMYHRKKESVIAQPFVEFVTLPHNRTSTMWGDDYKLMASSVVISFPLVGSPNLSVDNSWPIAEDGPDPTEAYSIRALTNSMKAKKLKNSRLPGIPDELMEYFPENLLLGPEQLKAISCKSDRILIIGEPGTGKTSVFLYLLFMHTARCKHLLESPNFNKVLFFVPEYKTEFRRYVEDFIKKHCDKTYATVAAGSEVELRNHLHDELDLILVDECSWVNLKNYTHEIERSRSAEARICGIVYEKSGLEFEYERGIPWNVFQFSNAYRCPSNVSLRYTKIRRKEKTKSWQKPLFLPFLNCVQHFINDRSAIKILKYERKISEWEMPRKDFDEESLLVVVIDLDHSDFEVDTTFAERFYDSFIHRVKLKLDFTGPRYFLPYTGVQYHTVVIILGANVAHYDASKNTINEILYHTMSRCLRKLIIFCPEDKYDEISRTLSLDNLDLSVFMKIKNGQELSEQDFNLLKTKEDFMEAVVLLRSKSTSHYRQIQIKTLLEYICKSYLDDSFKGVITDILVTDWMNFEDQDLVSLLESAMCREDNFKIFLEFYIGCEKYSNYPRAISKMRMLIAKLGPQLQAQWKDFLCQLHVFNKRQYFWRLKVASIIWRDGRTFFTLTSRFKTCIQMSIKALCELSTKMPIDFKRHFQPHYGEYTWVKIDAEMQACFEQFSSLTEGGYLSYDTREIKSRIEFQLINAMTKSFDESTCLILMEILFPHADHRTENRLITEYLSREVLQKLQKEVNEKQKDIKLIETEEKPVYNFANEQIGNPEVLTHELIAEQNRKSAVYIICFICFSFLTLLLGYVYFIENL